MGHGDLLSFVGVRKFNFFSSPSVFRFVLRLFLSISVYRYSLLCVLFQKVEMLKMFCGRFIKF